MLQGYYSQIIQLGMQTKNEQLLQVAIPQALQGASEAMRQVLESFDIRNIDKILITMPSANSPQAQNIAATSAQNSMIPDNASSPAAPGPGTS